jgi:hypothetical protein
MQKRSLWVAPDQLDCRLHNQLQPSMFFQLLLRVASDSSQSRRPNQDILHYSICRIFYTTMPFGLKSTGATYQRGIQWCLHSQIGCNTEAYVDDVVIKTQEEEELISDLAETFDNLRKFKMKLNPEKCTFGVPSRKLLGYMVSHRGIDPNPEKVLAITKMKLTGCMTALSMFLSRLSVRGLPLFKLIKKQDNF